MWKILYRQWQPEIFDLQTSANALCPLWWCSPSTSMQTLSAFARHVVPRPLFWSSANELQKNPFEIGTLSQAVRNIPHLHPEKPFFFTLAAHRIFLHISIFIPAASASSEIANKCQCASSIGSQTLPSQNKASLTHEVLRFLFSSTLSMSVIEVWYLPHYYLFHVHTHLFTCHRQPPQAKWQLCVAWCWNDTAAQASFSSPLSNYFWTFANWVLCVKRAIQTIILILM